MRIDTRAMGVWSLLLLITDAGAVPQEHGAVVHAWGEVQRDVAGLAPEPAQEGRSCAALRARDLLAKPLAAHGAGAGPEVEWMSYVGGSGVDWAVDIAIDASGAAIISGHTTSMDFEGAINEFHGGSSDAFVARVDPSGTVQWMIYLGGSGDELLDFDIGRGMALDSDGNAIITGWTSSDDFAGANNSHHGGSLDAFAARVTPSGTLDWATYLGGGADDLGFAVDIDAAGAALITGQTYSSDFEGALNEHHGGVHDAFLARVLPSGVIDWMTYLGGSGGDHSAAVAVHDSGAVFVAGDTWSTDFEGRNNTLIGAIDAFAARVHPSGVIDWMTYLGGSSNEAGHGIAADSQGIVVSGATTSTDFVGRNNRHHGGSIDAFLTRIDSAGSLQWMTYLGGSGVDSALRVIVDAQGVTFASGRTESNDFEGRIDSFHGFKDAWVGLVPPSGFVEWVTYLGGSGDDAGFGIARTDDAALVTGRTNSTDFVGSINRFHGGESWGDAFVLKLALTGPPGDLDGDGSVGFSDLLILLSFWGPCGGCEADLDGDGSVGLSDLLVLLASWGE